MAIFLEAKLRPVLSDRIFHLAGTPERKRGCKAAVREVAQALPDKQFVFRTDVKGYYASINHDLLLAQLKQYVHNPFLLRLLRDFLQHDVHVNGRLRQIQQGISLGCPLSPLLGALYLKPLDDAMAKTVVLSPTRWKLRRAIATVNQRLAALKMIKHPDKTSIGRSTAGFDFLGFHLRLLEGVETVATPPLQMSVTLGDRNCVVSGAPAACEAVEKVWLCLLAYTLKV